MQLVLCNVSNVIVVEIENTFGVLRGLGLNLGDGECAGWSRWWNQVNVDLRRHPGGERPSVAMTRRVMGVTSHGDGEPSPVPGDNA